MMDRTRTLQRLTKVGAVLLLAFAQIPSHAAPCGQRENDVHAPYRQVTWKDFKGKLPKSLGVKAAHIASAIVLKKFEVDSQRDGEGWVAKPTKICLYTSMNKLESARRVGHENKSLLAHEQAHFDITEIFTRNLYGKLKEMAVRDADAGKAAIRLRTEISSVYEQTLRDWRAMQTRYDSESGHGTQKRKQKKWLSKVRELLAAAPPVGS